MLLIEVLVLIVQVNNVFFTGNFGFCTSIPKDENGPKRMQT